MNWLLLRGLSRESAHWGNFTGAVQNMPNVKRVMTLDVPGVGTNISTENEPIPYLSVRETVSALRAQFLKRYETNSNWSVIGISYGGMLSLEWASEHPHDFKQAVIINSSSANTPVFRRLKLRALMTTFKSLIILNSEKRESEILKMVSNLRSDDVRILQDWVEIATQRPVDRRIALYQLFAASQFKLPAAVTPKVLVLTSKKDKMVDWRCSKTIAEKYQAVLKVHDSAGHDLPLDDSEWVIAQILEFTKNNGL